MKRAFPLRCILATGLTAFVVTLLAAGLAFAIPLVAGQPPAASFSGNIQVNGENLPDGTLIIAMINGEAYAANYIQTNLGRSVYGLDVPGDDPGTVEREEAVKATSFSLTSVVCWPIRPAPGTAGRVSN